MNYYDNYDFQTLLAEPVKTQLNYTALTGYATKYVSSISAISAKGLLTGTQVYMLDNSFKIVTAMYYDNKGRLAQSKATNHLGGYERDYFSYTFTGKPLKRRHEHVGNTTVNEVYSYIYDNAERVLKTTYSLNDAVAVTLSENSYDDLGRLLTKKQHAGVETTTYGYNLRSWLKSIGSSRYSQNLYYNESSGGNNPCYNGNISATSWTLKNDIQRGYNFSYDGLNRITAADYLKSGQPFADYNAMYGYDKMGNLTNLQRYGLSAKPSTFGLIDDLVMSYTGNQLSGVTDRATGEPLYAGAFNFVKESCGTPEYTYDANGNLTRDSHKKIASIQYNSLNLPSQLQFTQGHTTEYLYDADGVKRSVKQVTTTQDLMVPMGSTLSVPTDKIAVKTLTDYCGNVIYENGTLSKILVDGGYITMSNGTPTYHYYIQDHLGNNRVVFNQSGTVEQANHYYPFGMTFGEGIDNSDNRYKYNNKELDRMHGLDLYDYGARFDDPALGKWHTPDELGEIHFEESPILLCWK